MNNIRHHDQSHKSLARISISNMICSRPKKNGIDCKKSSYGESFDDFVPNHFNVISLKRVEINLAHLIYRRGLH